MSERDTSQRMALTDHIDEIRVRLVRAVAVFFVGFMVAFLLVREDIATFLRAPLFAVMDPSQQRLYYTGMFEGFFVHVKLSAVATVFLLAPYFFWEIWAFIAPGLYPKEKKYFLPFMISATVFFFGGAAFAYKVLFPIAFQYFLHFGDATEVPWLTMDSYYSTALKLLLLFGLSFEFPVLLFFLGLFGWVTPEQLREQRRVAVIVITVFSAMFAPPDAISMVLMMVPLYLMYEGIIVVLGWALKRQKRDPQANS